MKILITGGAGFIGSTLCDHLLEQGEEILVLDNYATARRDNLKKKANLLIVKGTIANENLVNRIFNKFKPDKVVHAAASYKNPENWEEDIKTNVLGTSIVVRACERYKIQRLIYFQTALCYGLHPLEQPITLNHIIDSRASSYAISKTAAEHYIQLSNLDYISFRLANAYGPRNMSGPVPTFYYRLSHNKPCFIVNTRRDFIFVDDLIDIVIKALDGRGERGVYHVSSGCDYSIKELFEVICEAMGIVPEKGIEIVPRTKDDVHTILLDPSKTNKDFDWQPITTLRAGVRKAVEYYNKYNVTGMYTHLKIK